jgi:succinoglycan biosynthesis protein ExoM
MSDVTVAIPSFRRPRGLKRLLLALERLDTKANVRVLVADNDAERREALALCRELNATGYRWPLVCVVAPERGIAQARNALVEHVLANGPGDFIAMLDDDEWPDPGWLDVFLSVQKETGADALHGAVLRDFEQQPGVWAQTSHGIAPLRGTTGAIPMIEGTSNVLISRACLEGLEKPCFDPNFALTGGEDRDFFERLRRQGRRFAWADEAVVHSWVPASRASFVWVLQRAYRTGNSDMRVFLKHGHSRIETVREVAKIAAAATLCPGMLIVLAPFVRRWTDALCKLCRAAGKTTALMGRRYDEYATIHGA